jgi:hypothetical protein
VKSPICITLFLFILSLKVFGINRIATEADRAIYGDYITPGDLIIDSPTKVTPDKVEVIYYFMAKEWPLLREGATIWFDGKKLGFVNAIKFNHTSKATTPWHVEKVTFRNIPNTQLRAGGFYTHGLLHAELNGESEFFPGLKQWPESRKFLTGAFGIHITSKMFGGHGIYFNVRDGGTIKLRGFEVQHGFSAVRINGGNHDLTVEGVEMTNFYIHDTGDGEGLYLGATHAPPLAKIKNVKVHDGIFTRTAAEAMQLQHLVGGTEINNVIIRGADVRWMNEFRAGQDTGIQWSVDAGENKMHHIILDGFAGCAMIPFSSNEKPVGGVSIVSDILFNDGIDTGMYLHKSGSFGVKWIFDNVYYMNFGAGCYYEGTGRPERNYIISAKHGKDEYIFKKVIYDRTKQKIFQDTSGIDVIKTDYQDLPSPEYVNSGFHEPAKKIKQWSHNYAKYFPASKAGKVMIPTDWQIGDIAIETQGEYSFYKCVVGHTATEQRPSENRFFVKLTWDQNGVRSDQPGWKNTPFQSNIPPDDLRLKPGSYWDKLGYGIRYPGSDQTEARKR